MIRSILITCLAATLHLAGAQSDDSWSPSLDLHLEDHSLDGEDDSSLDDAYLFPNEEKPQQLYQLTDKIADVGEATPQPPAAAQPAAPAQKQETETAEQKGILINFNNVNVVEFIRFISRITNKNFIFDDQDLRFNVTMVSEEPTSIENIMTGLMQTLRVHDLNLMEQGNNLIIHRNKLVNQISTVIADGLPGSPQDARADIVTQVFRLNTLDVDKGAELIRPLVSQGALVEVLTETSHIVVTDIKSNVDKIGKLLKSIDAPTSGLTIGQYVVVNALLDSLINLAKQIMQPIAETKPLVFVGHNPSNSIFVVSTPFIVDQTLAVLRNLDINVGETRVFTPDNLRFTGTSQEKQQKTTPEGGAPGAPGTLGGASVPGAPGGEEQSPELQAERYRALEALLRGETPPPSTLGPGTLENASPWTSNLPAGHIERTKFYIYKLRFRKGEQIAEALGKIANTLQESGSTNLDLISSIYSIQWLQASNALVFTGTISSITKVKELIEEIDTPLRQVFLEMLLLDTTIDESLNFGVNFGARFNNGNTAGAEAFLSDNNNLSSALDGAIPGGLLDASPLARTLGYHLGIVGRNVTHCGVEFSSIGALVNALHDKNKDDIVMNPKLLVEDNATAEIFVGLNAPFKTQSIANDQGTTITNNFEYRDIGTRMKVTPLISNNDVITLDIEEEVSTVADTAGLAAVLNQADAGPTTRKSNSVTRVHVPNRFFLVMSGMIQDEHIRRRQQVPCLGGVPVLGGLFSDKRHRDQKRNLMIFIRPVIVDTEAEMDEVTVNEQKSWNEKYRTKKMWKYEVEEALDLLNLKEPEVSLHDSEIRNP